MSEHEPTRVKRYSGRILAKFDVCRTCDVPWPCPMSAINQTNAELARLRREHAALTRRHDEMLASKRAAWKQNAALVQRAEAAEKAFDREQSEGAQAYRTLQEHARTQAELITRLREQSRIFFDVVYAGQRVVGNWERGMSPDHVSWGSAIQHLQTAVKGALEAATTSPEPRHPECICNPGGPRLAILCPVHEVTTSPLRRTAPDAFRYVTATYGCERCGRWDGMDASLDHDVWARIAKTRPDGEWRILCLWCCDEIAAQIDLPRNTPVRLYFPGQRLSSVLPEGDRSPEPAPDAREAALVRALRKIYSHAWTRKTNVAGLGIIAQAALHAYAAASSPTRSGEPEWGDATCVECGRWMPTTSNGNRHCAYAEDHRSGQPITITHARIEEGG